MTLSFACAARHAGRKLRLRGVVTARQTLRMHVLLRHDRPRWGNLSYLMPKRLADLDAEGPVADMVTKPLAAHNPQALHLPDRFRRKPGSVVRLMAARTTQRPTANLLAALGGLPGESDEGRFEVSLGFCASCPSSSLFRPVCFATSCSKCSRHARPATSPSLMRCTCGSVFGRSARHHRCAHASHSAPEESALTTRQLST